MYKIYLENAEKHVSDFWSDQEARQDYLNIVAELSGKIFKDLEYCLLNIYLINKSCGVSHKHFKICEITSSGNMIFNTIEEVKNKINSVKVFLDGSYFKDKTKSKEYFYSILDYNTKKNIIIDKLHMSNLLLMLNEDEEQDFVDGKVVFNLPLKLLNDFNGKPEGYGNKYSEYHNKKNNRK